MEVIVFNNPTKWFQSLLFELIGTENEIKLCCFQEPIDHVLKTRKLVAGLKYAGYELKSQELKEEIKIGHYELQKVYLFTLTKSEHAKGLKEQVDNDKEAKFAKEMKYNEPGKMIFLKKYTLSIMKKMTETFMKTKKMQRNEYNDLLQIVLQDYNKMNELLEKYKADINEPLSEVLKRKLNE